ncbi:QueG-associated DUF1730 domain-containing protein [Nitrosospira briensis]|uniref:QueG-associated DUF1730 domain-containing protein n=1 Tax=Nitrosospira briensis TaxID=35799 RepID=UPI001E586918|nr:QueG-associated DUF1730 domain-containing protein [Nitrosospira briensis]
MSRYAWGRDCHYVLRGRLQELADKITMDQVHRDSPNPGCYRAIPSGCRALHCKSAGTTFRP